MHIRRRRTTVVCMLAIWYTLNLNSSLSVVHSLVLSFTTKTLFTTSSQYAIIFLASSSFYLSVASFARFAHFSPFRFVLFYGVCYYFSFLFLFFSIWPLSLDVPTTIRTHKWMPLPFISLQTHKTQRKRRNVMWIASTINCVLYSLWHVASVSHIILIRWVRSMITRSVHLVNGSIHFFGFYCYCLAIENVFFFPQNRIEQR